MTEQEIRELIAAHAEEVSTQVVAAWREIAESEKWLSLPPSMGFDDLPNVIRAITGAALRPKFEEAACREILHYSSLHGDHRNTEGFQESYLHTEYHLLRRSLWDVIRQRLDTGSALRAITRVDAAITLATMAALRGFHCQTFAKRGDWPAALDRLLAEWPLVGQ